MTNIITESHDSPPYFQHLLISTSYPIYKTMLINQVLVDSILRTNYLTLLLTDTYRRFPWVSILRKPGTSVNKIGLINRHQLSKHNNINSPLVIRVNNIISILTFRELAHCNTKGFTCDDTIYRQKPSR
jgi:hypothetical protein